MHATEHADRFTVVLPNGQPMDVSKADLRPETLAELRSMVVPGLATKGDVSQAELDAIEEALAAEEGASLSAPSAPAPADAPMSIEPMGPPAPLVPRGPRTLARDAIGAAVAPAPAAMFAEQDVPLTGVAPLLDVNADAYPAKATVPQMAAQQFPGPGAGVPAEFGRVSLIPSFGDAVSAVFGGGDDEEKPATPVPAPAAATPPPAPVAPPADPDAELKARFKAFASGGSRGAPQISVRGVGERAAAPFAMPASYDEAIKQQYDLNERSAKLQADTAAEVERLSTEKGIKEQQMLDRDNAQRAEETRRLDQMREEAFNGTIDVNRAFDRMDGGQRALSLIGLLLGGIGAGNTGVNAAVGVMERMIDRDIDAQAKDLGRKQTAYSNAIQQGYHAEQARQRARLEAMSVLQGSIDRAAIKNGSERALLAGQAANAALSAKVATDTMAMQDKHLERQQHSIDSEYDREFKNATLRMQAEKMRQDREAAALAAFVKMSTPDPKIAALEHVLPDKSVVVASNPTSKAKLEIIQSAHSDMLTKIAEARKLRKDYGGGTIVPNSKILRATGLPSAVYADEAASLAGQMELAWLRGEAAGAYDVGSGKKAVEVMPSAADLGEEAFQNKIDRLERLANEKFRAGIVSLVRPASAQRF